MSKDNLLKSLDRFKDLKVTVLGDVILDVYDFCYSKDSRTSPERPDKKVYTASKSLITLGGAGNVAANLSALGVATTLIGVCGADGNRLQLQKIAEDSNIHALFLEDQNRITSIKTRLYIDDEYILRRDNEDTKPVSSELANTSVTKFNRELKGSDAVIISDYNKGFFTDQNAPTLIRNCRDKNVPVVVDFKPANFSLFRGASAIGPNLKEAKQLEESFEKFDLNNPAKDLTPIKKLYEKLNSELLFVTLGGYGTCAYDGKNFYHRPVIKVPVVDSVGLGDTVRAALSLGLACGLSVDESLDLGNAAAAVAIQKLGTATVNTEELKTILQASL